MNNYKYFDIGRDCINEENFFQNEALIVQKVISGKILSSHAAEGFLRLNKASLLCVFYSILSKKDKQSVYAYLLKCNSYNLLALSLCLNTKIRQFSLDEKDMAYSIGLLFLLNEKKDFMDFFTTYIRNEMNILSQYKNSFSLENIIVLLLCKSQEINIDYRNSTYQKLFNPHKQMLEELYNKDTTNINTLIYILCEMHLELRQQEKDRINNINYLFPYEVLVWLKIRKGAGLKNPKTFSHPLMKTPIAKIFLDIEEPLAKPTELPYAKELLEKLKEKYPNVEIPEWLNGVDTPFEIKEEVTLPKNNTIPDDFMK